MIGLSSEKVRVKVKKSSYLGIRPLNIDFDIDQRIFINLVTLKAIISSMANSRNMRFSPFERGEVATPTLFSR